MSNTKEDIEIIKKKKLQFAKDFIGAVSNQSIEKCKKLIVPFDEYKKLVDDKDMTADKYDEVLTKQCKNFFDDKKDFFNKHKTRLLEGQIDSSIIYDLGDKHEIDDNFYFSTINALTISMEKNILEDDTISTLEFQIDNPVVINSTIRINNFLLTRAYESMDDSIKVKKQYEKMGFKELSTDKYLEIMKDKPFNMGNNYKEVSWFLYEGDLHLSADEFNSLADNRGFLVTGSLVVDGTANIRYNSIIALEDFKAKNILIDLDDCSIASFCIFGTVFFDEVLILEPNDSPFLFMNNIEGKFVFAGYGTENIKVLEEKVNFFYDMHGERSFGNVENFLEEKFVEQYSKDEVHVNLGEIHEAILNNESIFRK